MSATHRPPSRRDAQRPTTFAPPRLEADHTSASPQPFPIGPFGAQDRDAVRRVLHPLLGRFLEVRGDGLLAVRSPWGYQWPLTDVALANAECSRRNALVHEALAQGDVPGALIHVERPYRLNVLDVVRETVGLSPVQLREGAAFAWSTLELVYPVAPEGLRLLKRVGFITDAAEVLGAALKRRDAARCHDWEGGADACGDGMAALPAEGSTRVSTTRPTWLADAACEVSVYRGASSPKHLGPCWTRDREIAEWYARRFPVGTPTLFTGVVTAGRVLAYFECSDERTVVVDPAHVLVTAREPLDALA